MNTLIIILIIAICYWRIRNLYYNSIELELQLKLYRLRDKLRMAAIDGKVNSEDWVFDYMDSSICKSIEEVSSLNILSVIALHHKNKENTSIQHVSKMIDESMEKNNDLKRLFREYGNIMVQYFFKKHYIIRNIVTLLAGIIVGVSVLQKRTRFMVEELKFYPETSTANRYVNL